MPKIAVYTMAKNEAEHVGRFAATVRGADRVVVTDTGSTDGTPDLLRDAGIEVHSARIVPWRFDVASNVALAHVPDDVGPNETATPQSPALIFHLIFHLISVNRIPAAGRLGERLGERLGKRQRVVCTPARPTRPKPSPAKSWQRSRRQGNRKQGKSGASEFRASEFAAKKLRANATPPRCRRSLTEPPRRPKVSSIAGDLRSVVWAGAETLAER
jgi:glycosyltransferase involved in cell wall biosynthesis